MKLVDIAIKKPVTVTVGVILLVLFGFISLFRIPIQLTPNVDLPEISIQTRWSGASPLEVEREIVDVQEEQLKNLDGLEEINSESRDGSAYIKLMFEIGTDNDEALLRVSNKLDQVKKYPDNIDKPIIKSGGRHDSAFTWMILKGLDGYNDVLKQEYDFIDEHVKPRLERIAGVASVNIYGGQERQVQVIVDSDALAARKVTIPELMRVLDIENKNISAGNFDEGKRRYIARTVGEFNSVEDVAKVIIKRINQIPVTVGDVAKVVIDYENPEVVVRHEGVPTIVMNAVREPGSNILVVMNKLKKALEDLNNGILKEKRLVIIQVYDETGYIYSAINLVRKNIFIGGTLAVIVLLLFLRNFASTIIVSIAIPISVIGTFLVMTLFGRNINVVSLAGLSFAIGMVVDNSIVVFENIFRHREMGKTRAEAAYDGTTEVWGAVLASTLTTVAVFLPIVFVQEEAGQLFRDIAIAISSAVVLSLIISITAIPTLSAKILGKVKQKSTFKQKRIKKVYSFAKWFADSIAKFIYWMCGRVSTRVGIVVLMTSFAIAFAWTLAPKTEYLPEGNREMLFGILLPPPGYNLDELEAIAKNIEKDILPLIEHEGKSETAQKLNLPPVKNFFYVAFGQQVFMGIVSKIQERTRELLPYVYSVLKKIPGMIAIVQQPGLFSRGIGKGRSIEIEIKGPELTKLISLGKQIFGMSSQALPGSQIRPIPGLDLGNPEMRIIPNRDRLSRLGMTTYDLGLTVNVLVDGAKASNYRLHGNEIDLVIKNKEGKLERTQDLAEFPVIAPSGEKVTLGSLADISLQEGPTTINHIDSQRAITIMVIPPRKIPLETAMDIIRDKVVNPIKASGTLSNLYSLKIGGTADDLTRTKQALMWNFILAIVISYLLMSALFENFFYPLIIMFSVPLAAAGGFIGLFLVNFRTYQPLDIITMLGFIILVGIVVNNAILIVYQTLNNIREGKMDPRDAIVESVRTRIRPIYMSSITTVCAMLPLVLSPGAGSEFYRGLGSVIVGGLLASTVFTIFLIPALLSLAFDAVKGIRKYL